MQPITTASEEVMAMHSAIKLVAIAAATLLASGCNLMKGKETTGQYVDDSTIATRAKAALIGDKQVSATDFNIDVYKGKVTLSGVAKTPEEAQRAVEDIRKVPGVKSVQNATRVATTERGSTRSE
jgi:osmotically-inducible protein OsmY